METLAQLAAEIERQPLLIPIISSLSILLVVLVVVAIGYGWLMWQDRHILPKKQ